MLLRIRPIFRLVKVRVLVLDAPDELKETKPQEDIEITQVTFENIDRVLDFRNENILHTFRAFLEEGDIGVYAWKDSKVVGHLWGKVCRGSSCRVHGYFDIHRGEALLLYGNVREDCRGLGIFKGMLSILCKLLFTKARIRRILADPWVDNIPSFRGISRLGFKLAGKGTYFLVAGRLVFRHFASMTD